MYQMSTNQNMVTPTPEISPSQLQPQPTGHDTYIPKNSETIVLSKQDSNLTSTKSTKKGPEPKLSGKEMCLVCGDLASGFNYGVLSCEGCKAFYRRSVKDDGGGVSKGEAYKCLADQNCNLFTPSKRKCQACRYKVCKDLGMTLKYKSTENYRKNKAEIKKRQQIECQINQNKVKKLKLDGQIQVLMNSKAGLNDIQNLQPVRNNSLPVFQSSLNLNLITQQNQNPNQNQPIIQTNQSDSLFNNSERIHHLSGSSASNVQLNSSNDTQHNLTMNTLYRNTSQEDIQFQSQSSSDISGIYKNQLPMSQITPSNNLNYTLQESNSNESQQQKFFPDFQRQQLELQNQLPSSSQNQDFNDLFENHDHEINNACLSISVENATEVDELKLRFGFRFFVFYFWVFRQIILLHPP